MTLDPRLIAAAKRLSEEPIFAHYRFMKLSRRLMSRHSHKASKNFAR